METSAKDATNVTEAFHDLLKEMYCELSKTLQLVENKNINNKGNNAIELDVDEQKKKKKCC